MPSISAPEGIRSYVGVRMHLIPVHVQRFSVIVARAVPPEQFRDNPSEVIKRDK